MIVVRGTSFYLSAQSLNLDSHLFSPEVVVCLQMSPLTLCLFPSPTPLSLDTQKKIKIKSFQLKDFFFFAEHGAKTHSGAQLMIHLSGP